MWLADSEKGLIMARSMDLSIQDCRFPGLSNACHLGPRMTEPLLSSPPPVELSATQRQCHLKALSVYCWYFFGQFMPLLDWHSGKMTGNKGERDEEWHATKVPGRIRTGDVAVHGHHNPSAPPGLTLLILSLRLWTLFISYLLLMLMQ